MAGENAAFRELYDQTYTWVYAAALRVVRSPDLAIEVAQEVYLEAWRKAADFDPDRGPVLAWLTVMARRRAVDRLRQLRASQGREQSYAARHPDLPIDDVWDRVMAEVEVDEVRAGLRRLTPLQREALVLAFFEEHTHSQIASLLVLPLGTVKTRIRDGLIHLSRTLGVTEQTGG